MNKAPDANARFAEINKFSYTKTFFILLVHMKHYMMQISAANMI